MMRLRRGGGVVLLALMLLSLAFASLAVGSNALPFSEVLAALRGEGSAEATRVVFQQRLPRMVVVIIVGAALAVAGALMQTLTRNPLADPGILGVNAGASLAVVLAVLVFGETSIRFYVWFALVGAALACAIVLTLGGAKPTRLVLAGMALTMAVSALVQLAILTDQHLFNEFRLWAAGSVESRGFDVVAAVSPFIVVGLALAVAVAPALNALTLGDAVGTSLGVNVQRVRLIAFAAIAVLAGAGTAAAGPIMFIGLGVPYVACAVCGPDLRWVLPVSAVAGPLMLLVADLFARVVVAPQEIQTGILTALLGGPLFIAIVRRRMGRTV